VTSRWLALALCLGGCKSSVAQPELAAGSGTVFDTTADAFSLPLPTLSPAHRDAFFVGNSYFNQNWLSAPSTQATRDGLGPLFNARSCSGCHFKDGRGHPPESGEAFVSVLVRVSLAADGGRALSHPRYGAQIQDHALPGVAPEAAPALHYEEVRGAFPDGERYSLRRPRVTLEQPGYGAFEPELLLSMRAAPALIGAGMLEAVPESEILTHADPSDADHDGISGRANRLQNGALGRFGWKAETPSIRVQVAAAFVEDMGLTTPLSAADNCSPAEPACAALPNGGSPEVTPDIFEAVVSYARTLAVPARREPERANVRRGALGFEAAGCNKCHVRTLHTGRVMDLPELSDLTLHPYTDLLLHDMGEGLSDHRPSFAADGGEWRTPALWGLGLVDKVNQHREFLHDGRARGVNEAVLWHAGEAEAAKRAFMQLPRAAREDLIAFVESL
jgi:CxxC motif-containing protein (DUF1111 family)